MSWVSWFTAADSFIFGLIYSVYSIYHSTWNYLFLSWNKLHLQSFPLALLCASLFSAVPELSARGVIQQVFPLHEQRILSQLMKSWVQAVCEKQPLGHYGSGDTH